MRGNRIYKAARITVNILSLEFLLTACKWPNGGTVIFIRALVISLLVTTLYGILIQLFDPSRIFAFSLKDLQLQTLDSIKIYGAVFAAIYLALYSRFSSQWGYLSNLFNQIKQTESTGKINEKVLNYWKAGFIEDAIELHLARKPMFAIIIKGWSKDAKVQNAFEGSVPNGKALFKDLMDDLKRILRKK